MWRVLECSICCIDLSIIAAAEGHPCLRELSVSGEKEAWLCAIPRLPALAALELHVDRRASPRRQLSEELADAAAAGGGRLWCLAIRGVQLPPTLDAVVTAMHSLVPCFPHLEVLKLEWEICNHIAERALSRQLLRAVPALAPLFPALRQVQVKQSAVKLRRYPDGGVAAATFEGSWFE